MGAMAGALKLLMKQGRLETSRVQHALGKKTAVVSQLRRGPEQSDVLTTGLV